MPLFQPFFSFSLLLSTSGRALVMLGPGAAHGFPPSSGACHRGAHQQRKTGRDPKSHVGGPGRYCSRGDERRFFPHPSYAGGLGELRGARGWLTWRCWPENATPVVPCRPLSRPRLWAATAAVLAVMLVWVNEKAIFCSDFSRVVFDGLL